MSQSVDEGSALRMVPAESAGRACIGLHETRVALPSSTDCACGARFGVEHACPVLPDFSGEDMHETTEPGEGGGEGECI